MPLTNSVETLVDPGRGTAAGAGTGIGLPPAGNCAPLVVDVLAGEGDLTSIATEWLDLLGQPHATHIEHQPAWIRSELVQGRRPLVFVLRDGARVPAIAAFLVRASAWPCRLGYKTICRFRVRMARLCGPSFIGPEDPQVCERLLDALAKARDRYDLVFLEGVPVSSALWTQMRSSASIRRHFWLHMPAGPSPRRRLRMSASFDEYMARFSSKTRLKLRNAVKKMETGCDVAMAVQRVSGSAELAGFLEAVEAISAKSWQGTRLAQVVRSTGPTFDRLATFAEEGWLRSYVLTMGSEPVAFVIGYQVSGTYYYEKIGYDPAWADYSPGKVLLLKLLDDLHSTNPPDWLDFGGGESEYKRLFATDVYDEAHAYLVRKSPRMAVALLLQRAALLVTTCTRTGLSRLGIRERVRHVLRGTRRSQHGHD